MPFNRRIPHPFTSGAVHVYAPSSAGVYGISNAREWVYIGQTDDIRDTLLVHLQHSETWLMDREPTGFIFEICDGFTRSARHDRLVQEYKPTCNRMSSSHL